MKYRDRCLLAENRLRVLEKILEKKTYNEKFLQARVRELEEHLSPK